MEFHNTFAITMTHEDAATTAYGIIKNRLALGFESDNQYRMKPSILMASSLLVRGNTICVPEEMSFYTVCDIEEVFIALLKNLAEQLSTEAFTFQAVNTSTYDGSTITAYYDNDTLRIKSVYAPYGNAVCMYCPECGEYEVLFEDYEEGKMHFCPKCGEEVDWDAEYADQKPTVEEYSYKIV